VGLYVIWSSQLRELLGRVDTGFGQPVSGVVLLQVSWRGEDAWRMADKDRPRCRELPDNHNGGLFCFTALLRP
jgi:hypothetical protein